MRRTSALIIGGGPAGAAAAITLARANVRAIVLERQRETADALCGGFVSWRTLDRLASLGLDSDLLNPEPIRRVRILAGEKAAEAMLPRPARAVSRRRLDQLLLTAAERSGAGVERGAAVRMLDGTIARLADGSELHGHAVFLASGKHDVRGTSRDAPVETDPAVGLRFRAAAHPSLARLIGDAVELHCVTGGYVGVVRQEDGGANLCLAIRRSRLRDAGDVPSLMRELARECPTLAERLGFVDGPTDAVANVPYGWRATSTLPGVFRLGDQAGVIPSLAGEGMGIAIASGIDAARAHVRGESAPMWQARTAAALRPPMVLAGAIRRTAEQPASAGLLVMLARLAPGLVPLVAQGTRVRLRGD